MVSHARAQRAGNLRERLGHLHGLRRGKPVQCRVVRGRWARASMPAQPEPELRGRQRERGAQSSTARSAPTGWAARRAATGASATSSRSRPIGQGAAHGVVRVRHVRPTRPAGEDAGPEVISRQLSGPSLLVVGRRRDAGRRARVRRTGSVSGSRSGDAFYSANGSRVAAGPGARPRPGRCLTRERPEQSHAGGHDSTSRSLSSLSVSRCGGWTGCQAG